MKSSVFPHPLLLLFAIVGFSARGEIAETDLLRAEIEELRSVVLVLRQNNERLQNRLDAQAEELILTQREVGRLASRQTSSVDPAVLTKRPSEVSGTPPAENGPTPVPVSAKMDAGFVVDYVNAAHHYIVLRAGTEEGLDSGQKGRVIRDGNVIASVEVIHVLPQQAVADILPESVARSGVYPRSRDLVVIP